MSDPKDESDEELEPGFSLSSILFGNVDKNGELIDGFLDKDTSKHLRSLDQLNIASGLIDEIRDDVQESIRDAKNKDQQTADKTKADDKKVEAEETEENYSKKDDDAIDYSDENEMADDQTSEDDIKFKEALSELVFKMPTAPISKPPISAQQQQQKKKLDEDDDYDTSDSDARPNSEKAAPDPKRPALQPKDTTAVKPLEKGVDKPDATDSAQDEASKEAAIAAANKKRLDTPLAEMLPSKYANCDVTDIFPEFRPNKTLRFSRLFVASKSSLLPNPWKNVKNKKRKKKRTASETAKDSEAGKEEATKEPAADDALVPFDESVAKLQKSANEAPFQLKFAETVNPDEVEEDQEDLLKRPLECKNYLNSDDDLNGDFAQKVANWRNGPAAFWYNDMFVPEASKIFDFGFKKRQQQPDEDSETNGSSEEVEDDLSDHSLEDCYHMVTQGQWEEEIIWNGEDCKQKILAKNTEKYNAAGWVPSGANRTASAFIKQVRGSTLPSLGQKPSAQSSISTHGSSKKDKNKDQSALEAEKDETWYSMFPAENEELVYGIWEGDVIWDADNLSKIPEPKILTLDPNDENIVLGIPADVDPSLKVNEVKVPIPLKEKKEHHLKKSRILLGKAGVIAEPEPESPPPTEEEKDKDPYNISNDDYYNPKLVQNTALKPTVGVNLIQHSIPALELRPIFFPTYMGPIKLRSFHRPPLKRYSHGTVADSLSHPVIPLLKHMKKKAKQREQERLAAGGGDMFFMRTPEDVSGKDGDLILCEYSEEHPPLMMQVGMATKIKNYYKRKLGKDAGAPENEYGETIYAHTTPFLGNLAPGHSLQAIENNLFRAPIYNHHLPDTDFLIIRTRNNYFIRNVETIFTIGQQLPLYEVPGPNSKKANNFIRDFLQVFIYRLFWSSTDIPKRIKMEDIKKAFPSHSESSIRKRLKLCADFKRTGSHSNWWVLKPEFRLPTEEEMRAMVSPEQCCAFYSMIAAEQRLKDAGYGEKTLFTAEDENDEDQQLKMDDEVKTAPWNTTRAFIAAMKGKCLLQLNGVADPTGCGEGFSYVRIPNKPQISKEDIIKQQEPKKTVTGTDADLRRLPLSAAKNLLRKHNVPEEEIKKLSRWEVIDVVRTLSTAQAKAGAETSKFARGNRFSIAEHQERYKEEAQRIFELQNRLLGSAEELSTDDDESDENDEEDMDYEEMGKSIENIIANKKTSQQLSLEKEEEERKELRKLMLMGEDSNPGDSKKKGAIASSSKAAQQPISFADDEDSMSNQGKLLKIYRTYRNADGKEYIRIETVRKPNVITAYVKLRQTKDPDQIKKFTLALDEQEKEEYRKVKRRLQEQLRRLKRNAEKSKAALHDNQQYEQPALGRPTKLSLSDEPVNDFGIGVNSSMYDDPSLAAKAIGAGGLSLSGENGKKSREKKEKEKKESKVRCGNCGGTGHMKTNRICPLYSGELPPITVAMTEKEEQEQKTILERDDLIKVDDTKLIFSKALFNHEEEVRKKSLILKVPREVMKRKRRLPTDDYCDYLEKPDYKPANRRRKDPIVSLSIIFEEIAVEIKQMDGTDIFWLPVNSKKVKDYYNIITKPMDIQTIKKKIADKNYLAREDFLADWQQIYENSRLYNGPNHPLTGIAQRMYDQAKLRIEERAEKIGLLERTINPLLDNDQIAFSYLLESVILPRLRNVPESWPFHKPVNKKNVKNYYEIITKPIDLETMLANVKEHRYHSRQLFMNDIQLMYDNCAKYNGEESPLTKKALEIVEVAKQCLEEHDEKLKELETAILANKEAALDGDDSESVATGGLSNPDLMDENSSLADGDYRSESRAESAKNEYYGEINASDYEENSQSGQAPAVRRGQQDAMQFEQMMIDNEDNEDIVYDNYDPSKFLLDQFHQPAAMSEDDEEKSSSNTARPFEAIGRAQQVEPEEMADSNSRGVQEEESNDMGQQQQPQSSNFEQDLAMSDDSDDSANKMEIDNKSDNDSNDDDIWF